MKHIFISIFLLIVNQLDASKPTDICPDCCEANCIYQAIYKVYDESYMGLLEAIEVVCGDRGITDLKTIELIKSNYDL